MRTKGFNHSEETKNKMKKAHAGKKISDAAKIKIGNAHRGMKRSKETCKNISNSHKGVKLSEHHISRISESHQNLDKHPLFKIGMTRIEKLELIAGRKRPLACEICSRSTGKICFDHCHKSGKFRGWLCTNCNAAIGLVNEDPRIMTLLIKYIK